MDSNVANMDKTTLFLLEKKKSHLHDYLFFGNGESKTNVDGKYLDIEFNVDNRVSTKLYFSEIQSSKARWLKDDLSFEDDLKKTKASIVIEATQSLTDNIHTICERESEKSSLADKERTDAKI